MRWRKASDRENWPAHATSAAGRRLNKSGEVVGYGEIVFGTKGAYYYEHAAPCRYDMALIEWLDETPAPPPPPVQGHRRYYKH